MNKLTEEFNRILREQGLAGPKFRYWETPKQGRCQKMVFGYTSDKVRGPKGREGYQAFKGRPGKKFSNTTLWRRKKDAIDWAYVRYQRRMAKLGEGEFPKCENCDDFCGYYPERVDDQLTCLSCRRAGKV